MPSREQGKGADCPVAWPGGFDMVGARFATEPMRDTGSKNRLVVSAARLCRTVASALIAGVARRGDVDGVEARLAAMPVRDQTLIVGATLLALAALSFVAAQFGIIGLAVFWGAVILIVR